MLQYLRDMLWLYQTQQKIFDHGQVWWQNAFCSTQIVPNMSNQIHCGAQVWRQESGGTSFCSVIPVESQSVDVLACGFVDLQCSSHISHSMIIHDTWRYDVHGCPGWLFNFLRFLRYVDLSTSTAQGFSSVARMASQVRCGLCPVLLAWKRTGWKLPTEMLAMGPCFQQGKGVPWMKMNWMSCRRLHPKIALGWCLGSRMSVISLTHPKKQWRLLIQMRMQQTHLLSCSAKMPTFPLCLKRLRKILNQPMKRMPSMFFLELWQLLLMKEFVVETSLSGTVCGGFRSFCVASPKESIAASYEIVVTADGRAGSWTGFSTLDCTTWC